MLYSTPFWKILEVCAPKKLYQRIMVHYLLTQNVGMLNFIGNMNDVRGSF